MALSNTDRGSEDASFDLLGLGFGPANLALGVAIEESKLGVAGFRARFLEQQPTFAWHSDMLLADAELQISFFKDLVSLRNPCSRFTFLNYLREHGRLQRFANLRSLYPTRIEFNDYFRWAAEQLREQVQYGVRVVGLEPVRDRHSGIVRSLRVLTESVTDGRSSELHANNVVLGMGAQPSLPEGVDLRTHPAAFHASQFLRRMQAQFPDRNQAIRIVVVGSGQSAAEIVTHVLENYENAEVVAIMRRMAYRQSDESHFVNEMFASRFVDQFYDLPARMRNEVLSDHGNTNYSAVDIELVERLYRRLYVESIQGRTRLKFLPFCRVVGLAANDVGVDVQFEDRTQQAVRSERADGVVFATGYRWPRWHSLLERLRPWRVEDEAGGPIVERSYRLKMNADFKPGVYLQGYCETSHGLSDTLLSLLPFRAVDVLEDVVQRGLRSTSQPWASLDTRVAFG